MAKTSLYQLNRVGLVYPGEAGQTSCALQEVCLSIERGECWTIVGPSGSGKSSLLYLLAGLRQPTSGEILFAGQPLQGVPAKVAVILQDYGLFPWKTVYQNVALGLQLQKKEDKATIKTKVERVLTQLGIMEQSKKFPTQLSGGQKQRVAIARALVMEPEVLLMDEPFAALDALTKEGLEQLLLDICQKQRLTLVFVTHNMEEAIILGQKILVFGQTPGVVSAIIENPEYQKTAVAAKHQQGFYQVYERLREALGMIVPTSSDAKGVAAWEEK